ncbi:MAG: sulfatase [Pseudomonadota bacterium]
MKKKTGFARLLFLASILLLSISPLRADGLPNVILMVLDDMRQDDLEHMPKVQSLLVAQGLKFTEAYAVNATCCPARAAILRGQYPHNSGVQRVGDGFHNFRVSGAEAETLATHLKDAGYRTGLYGKYFVDYPEAKDKTYTPPGWEEWVAMGNKKGYYDYDMVENGVATHYGSNPEDYVTDVMAGKVVAAIGRAATDPRPFFLYVTPMAPHDPATPADRHLGLFSDLKSPRPPSFNENSVTDKPLWVRELAKLNSTQKTTIDNTYRDRLRSLQAVDEMVESMVDALAAQGRLDNTYFIFTSDQGYMLGEHRIPYGKGNSYEEAIRVPVVVRGPGVAAGVASSSIVLHTDLMPTILDLTVGGIPAFVDGRSFRTLLDGSVPKRWRSRFLVEHPLEPMIDINFEPPPHQTVHTKRYTYTEYVYTGEKEFYDLSTDPYQLTNSYVYPSGTVILGLQIDLATLKACSGAGCVNAEDDPSP